MANPHPCNADQDCVAIKRLLIPLHQRAGSLNDSSGVMYLDAVNSKRHVWVNNSCSVTHNESVMEIRKEERTQER